MEAKPNKTRRVSLPRLLTSDSAAVNYSSPETKHSSSSCPSPTRNLPLELLLHIFQFVIDSWDYREIPLLPLPGHIQILRCAQVCRAWSLPSLALLHAAMHRRDVSPRVGLSFLGFLSDDWTRICFLAKAALKTCRWALSPLRMFWIDDSLDLTSLMRKYPNPCHPIWESLLSCSLDILDTFAELVSSGSIDSAVSSSSSVTVTADSPTPLLSCQPHVPIMLKHSEKMDLGSFLLMYKSTFTGLPLLLRVKPQGLQKTSSSETGDGRLIIWDAQLYGRCSHCGSSLLKMQVCANCKVEQYCSRDCQREHWDASHRSECRLLGFKPVSSSRDDA